MNVDCIYVCFKRMDSYRESTRTICALVYHIGCGLVSRAYRHSITSSPSLSVSFCLSRYGYPVLRRLFLDVFVIAHVFLLCVCVCVCVVRWLPSRSARVDAPQIQAVLSATAPAMLKQSVSMIATAFSIPIWITITMCYNPHACLCALVRQLQL